MKKPAIKQVRRWKAGGWRVHINYEDGSWEQIIHKGDEQGAADSEALALVLCAGDQIPYASNQDSDPASSRDVFAEGIENSWNEGE